MASSFNLTIEDSSPLVVYAPSGAWQDASAQDTAGLSYSGSSYHSTTTQGATATVNFNGTGIEFYGGYNPAYGTYSLTVDGNVVGSGTSTSQGVSVRQLLASAAGLENGAHTAVLTSTGVGMDIDFVNLSTQVGAVGSTTTSAVFDDANTAVNYAGSWSISNTDAYLNNTLHYTQNAGSAASLSFSGNAVAVYGTVSPDHANIQISIDGEMTMVNTQSAIISELHPQTLLYYRNDLDSAQHMLIFTNPGQQNGIGGPFIDLDSITVYSASIPNDAASAGAPLPSSLSNQSNSTGASKSKPQSGLSKGTMIGIVAGAVAVILVFLALVTFLVMRSRKKRWQQLEETPRTPVGAELPLQGPNMRFTPVSPQQPMPTFSKLVSRMSAHSIAPSYYGSNNAAPSSFGSTTPLSVPTLAMPKVPSRAQQGVMIASQVPERPRRPPTLNLPAR
ncbi:hypothetical protein MSAN_00056700 [Mycena sanguinolenta]|uniref:Uncharacterized protein n=1 Tax=Mycena sanguinolenta TaxID=230812 RepID=A0A8H6ZEV7_9AGAR|nr:hypothetical protein MSAN_00056700 [Mycena sanguinolenta]